MLEIKFKKVDFKHKYCYTYYVIVNVKNSHNSHILLLLFLLYQSVRESIN